MSAREHVADAVPAEESVGDEGGERRLQRGVPDLAELAERGRGQGRRGAVELREDAVLDGERDRAARDGPGGARIVIQRRERDGVVGGVEVELDVADRRCGAVLDGEGELVAVAAG
ncbi:MAG: hypothetical protein HS111_08775 [Kofleriaceae bacterium]|nr:hypothetical protein [Kofleriaceae bacterium]